MNPVYYQALVGTATLLVANLFNFIRACGLPIPPEVDYAANQLLVSGLAAYLTWHGLRQALNTMPPDMGQALAIYQASLQAKGGDQK